MRQEPEWISGSRNSVTVVKTDNLSIVLIAIKKEATLCGHEVDGPITLQVISGAVKFGGGDGTSATRHRQNCEVIVQPSATCFHR